MLVDWAKFILSLATAFVAALWTIKTWRDQRDKEFQEERKRRDALFVNPFLLACIDLQSRLYNISMREGLVVLNKHYPNGSYAEEILYLIVQYFGWQRCIYRYYYEPDIIRVLEQIRNEFAKDSYDSKAFCFYRPEQRILGEIVMLRTNGVYGFEFDITGYDDFLRLLATPEIQQMKTVKQTLSTLRKAKRFTDLPRDVRERLVKIQQLLVGLLNLIEEKEKTSFFFMEGSSKRSKARLSSEEAASREWGTPMLTDERKEGLVFDYHTIRGLIGLIAISFPLVVGLRAWRITDSISWSYHTDARDFFVGFFICAGCFFNELQRT